MNLKVLKGGIPDGNLDFCLPQVGCCHIFVLNLHSFVGSKSEPNFISSACPSKIVPRYFQHEVE